MGERVTSVLAGMAERFFYSFLPSVQKGWFQAQVASLLHPCQGGPELPSTARLSGEGSLHGGGRYTRGR